mmetsp:Transcript_7364/g.19208  ORF Transcript_7364/g.19208 Transcript_7364/m.19208 type:complete len:254 (+) Transcript_7364:307-1068(+)
MSALEHVQTLHSQAALSAPQSSGAPDLAAADEAAAAARRRRDDAQESVRRRPTPRTRKALQDAQLLFRAAVAKSTAGQQRLMMEGLKRSAANNWRIEKESLGGWSARVDGRDAGGKLVGCYLDPDGREYRDREAVFAQLEHLRDRREGVVFIASATDAGPREGYVFARGYLGRGYYDADWPRAETPDSDRDLWSRLSPHFFGETSGHEYASARRAPAPQTRARCAGGPSRTCSAPSSPDLLITIIIVIVVGVH